MSGGAKVALPGEDSMCDEAKLALLKAKQIAFKAKSKISQPKEVVLQSPRVSVLDRLGPINSDLRDYLRNKRKLRFKDPVHVSASQCEQPRCQLVIVHSVHCCLGHCSTTICTFRTGGNTSTHLIKKIRLRNFNSGGRKILMILGPVGYRPHHAFAAPH